MVWKNPAGNLKMKICNESLSREKIYIGKKEKEKNEEKANLVIPIEKNQNGRSKEKKTPLGLLSYNAKKCSILSRAK